MTKINSNTFIKLWDEFGEYFTNKHSDWFLHYENNYVWWAENFVGTKTSSTCKSIFGNFLVEEKKLKNLRYRTEDGSFDLALSFAQNYSKLSYLHKNDISFFDVEGFYPTMYDVIIEIENDCRFAWQEMTKLTWVRSPLKVLVTYNWNPSDILIWETESKMLIDTFSNIVNQSNENFKDNSLTEYLLILGNKIDNKLNWTYHTFDSTGVKKKNGL